MSLIQTPGIARKLQRRLRLDRLPDGVLSDELVGVILVDDFTDDVVDEFTRESIASTTRTAVAAEFPHVGLHVVNRAPVSITRIRVASSTAQAFTVRVSTGSWVGLTASNQKYFKNMNLPGKPQSAFFTYSNAVVLTGDNIVQAYVAANAFNTIDFSPPLLLAAGGDHSGIVAHGGTLNTELRVVYEFTEGIPLG